MPVNEVSPPSWVPSIFVNVQDLDVKRRSSDATTTALTPASATETVIPQTALSANSLFEEENVRLRAEIQRLREQQEAEWGLSAGERPPAYHHDYSTI
jgi:hypothetical protein